MSRLGNDELYSELGPYLNTNTGGIFGMSYADQFGNAAAAMQRLRELQKADKLTGGQYNAWKSNLSSMKGQAVNGAATTALGGLTGIVGTAYDLAQNGNVQAYEDQLADYAAIGTGEYDSFGQLASEYSRINQGLPDLSYRDIRGRSVGEQIGGVASSTLAGASAGAAVGGPWGALAGAVVGLGGGLAGVGIGAANAHVKQMELQRKAQLAMDSAIQNSSAAGERLTDYNFRSGVSNRAAAGGKLQRKQQSIQEYAAKILRKPRRAGNDSHSTVTRIRTNGGTVIRFK